MLFVRTFLNQRFLNRATRVQQFVSQVSGSEKVEEKKIKIVLDEKDLTEKFVRGNRNNNFFPPSK
jgi:hypothetical protein